MKSRLLIAALFVSGCVSGQSSVSPVPGSSPVAVASGTPSAGVVPGAAAASPAAVSPGAPPSQSPNVIAWNRLPDLPVQGDLTRASVYARSVGDVYVATGTTTIWHLAGSAWEKQAVPGTLGVSNLSLVAGAVTGTSDDGTVFKLAGTTWAQIDQLPARVDTTAVLDVYGRLTGTDYKTPTSMRLGSYSVGSANDYQFLAGPKGLAWLKQKDSSTWTMAGTLSSDFTLMTTFLDGSAPQEAFMAGPDAAMVRTKGGAFLPISAPVGKSRINAITSAGYTGLYAAVDNGIVLYWGSEAWSQIVAEPKLGNVLGISAISPRETVMVSAKGFVYAGPYSLLR